MRRHYLALSLLMGILLFMLAACRPEPDAGPAPLPSEAPPSVTPTVPPESELELPTVTPPPSPEPSRTPLPAETATTEPEIEESGGTTGEDYTNEELGVRWTLPGEGWEFSTQLPDLGGVTPLVSLQDSDDPNRRVLLAYFEGSGTLSSLFMVQLEQSPEATIEELASTLGIDPEEAEITEVSGMPAVQAPLADPSGATIHFWTILAQDNLYYLYGFGFESAEEVLPLLEGLELPLPDSMAGDVDLDELPAEEQQTHLVAAAEEVRDLETAEEVPFELMTREALREEVAADLSEDIVPEEAEAEEQMLKLLGLIPADMDLTSALTELYGEQIAGFYEPEDGTFYLVSEGEEGSPLDLLDRLTFVHEYVHALQDQHFDLSRFTEDDTRSHDESRAFQALVEGDAQWASILYVMNNVSVEEIGDLAESTGELDAEALEAAPAFLRDSLLFPYVQGMAFVQAQQLLSGWEPVNDIWESPPRSTEQILHPARYPDDAPTAVELPGEVSGALGEGWGESLRDVWGEYDFLLLLQQQSAGAIPPPRAAEGWDGDQYLFLTNGERGLFAIEMVWDREQDAVEARTALIAWLGESGLGVSGAGRYAGEGRAAFVDSKNEHLYFALGNDEADMTAALGALGWQ